MWSNEVPSSAIGTTDKCVARSGGKRCDELNCTASAIGTTDKCVAHGGGNRCPNCIDWIYSRCGSIAYDGFCATCFQNFQRFLVVSMYTSIQKKSW